MKTIKIVAILVVVLFCGCHDEVKNTPIGNEEAVKKFMGQNQFGVYKSGDAAFVFDKEAHELVLNLTDKTFVFQTDWQASLLELKLDAEPLLNAPVKIFALASISVPGISSGTYNATVVKKEKDMVWLWGTKDQYGFIVLWDE